MLHGFLHVLKPDGFAEIRVPDLRAVMQKVVRGNLELNDVLYQSPVGPISVLDILYGLAQEIETSGSDFQQHKAGFTPQLLGQTLENAGFAAIFVFASPDAYECRALAFRNGPTPYHHQLLKLPIPPR